MSKKELVELVAQNHNVSKAEADRIVTSIFEEISKSLGKGNEVSISGFGKFAVSNRAAREGRNPSTGEKIKIAATRVPKFSASKTLKDVVKGNK